MPSNIFATTSTNVSILFIDKTNKDSVILVDASKLGTEIKEGKKQRTVLSEAEEHQIISIFLNKQALEDFSVVVDYKTLVQKNYSFSAGQYFDVEINHVDMSPEEFTKKMKEFSSNLEQFFEQSTELSKDIKMQLKGLRYE